MTVPFYYDIFDLPFAANSIDNIVSNFVTDDYSSEKMGCLVRHHVFSVIPWRFKG